MPILQSAKKRVKQDVIKRAVNDRYRRSMRERIKEFKKLVIAKDTKALNELLPQVYKALDKAAKQGVIKKNTASRTKSRLNKQVKELVTSK